MARGGQLQRVWRRRRAPRIDRSGRRDQTPTGTLVVRIETGFADAGAEPAASTAPLASSPVSGDADLRELLPPVLAGLDGSVEDYWRARIDQCFNDTYAGLPLIKFPEDLRVYEELLWEQAPNVVIEVGTHVGGSALWFRDRLLTLERYGRVTAPRVICLDVNQEVPRTALPLADPRFAEHIDLVECDICDPGAAALIAERVPEGANCLVVEDAAHTYDVTLASLRAPRALRAARRLLHRRGRRRRRRAAADRRWTGRGGSSRRSTSGCTRTRAAPLKSAATWSATA